MVKMCTPPGGLITLPCSYLHNKKMKNILHQIENKNSTMHIVRLLWNSNTGGPLMQNHPNLHIYCFIFIVWFLLLVIQ